MANAHTFQVYKDNLKRRINDGTARALGYFRSHYDAKGRYIGPAHLRNGNTGGKRRQRLKEPEDVAALNNGLRQGIVENTEGESSPSSGGDELEVNEKGDDEFDMEFANCRDEDFRFSDEDSDSDFQEEPKSSKYRRVE